MSQSDNFEIRLKGGHPNSLGNTVEVVEQVLANPEFFEELFNCYQSEDELVRLRTSNGVKRVALANKLLVAPYLDRLLNEISQIDQASAQWTLSQLFLILQDDMTVQQRTKAADIMKNNLTESTDWIVLNMTMETLGQWSKSDEYLKNWLMPYLDTYAHDKRKSVAKKAQKTIALLS